jgi:hypothetical protein
MDLVAFQSRAVAINVPSSLAVNKLPHQVNSRILILPIPQR